MDEEKQGNPTSSAQYFKIGCMITFGVFAACFITFCALPTACVMGTASVAAIGAQPTPVVKSTPMPTPKIIKPIIIRKPIAIATPTPIPTPSKFEVMARRKQYQIALGYKNHYDYWTSQAIVFKRHRKQADLANALQQQEMMKQRYTNAASDRYYRQLVNEEIEKERKRIEAARMEAALKPVRERARRDAAEARAYSEEFDRAYGSIKWPHK